MPVSKIKRRYPTWDAANKRPPRKLAIIAAVSLLTIAAGWFLLVIREEARRVTFVIPPGTGRQIEAGRPAVAFPAEINLTLGLRDTIVIKNRDDVVHSFGPFVVGPHSTLTKRFDAPVAYNSACTFHQEQQMRLVVKPAPWHIFKQ